MSDEEDYMSSEFLNVVEDVRPGLTFSKSLKRKHEIEKRQKESNSNSRIKSRKELEEESRNMGMNSALTASNKGFAMLQKMGYKPGMKLGNQERGNSMCNSGLSEPIKVTLKSDRGGLGREEEIRKKIKAREQKKAEIRVYKEKETELLTEEFHQRMRDKVVYKQLTGDLNKSRKVCQQLDAENDVVEPIRPWFWYQFVVDEDTAEDDEGEEEDDGDLDPEEQLSFILDYLRDKYFYCIWCGIRYDHEQDMISNCPGTEKSDHDDCS